MDSRSRLEGAMTYTQWAWINCSIFLLVIEAVALIRGDALLTDAMRTGANRWLLWPAVFGTLCGHFFGASTLPAWTAWFLVPLGLGILARDLFIGSQVAPINHLTVCILFIGIGALLWGSRT